MSERVEVFARVRPLLAREGSARGVSLDPAAPREVRVAGPVLGEDDRSTWRFARAFDEGASQAEVFEASCLPLVEAVLRGANAACITYGQTGTGKTHTMLGHDLWALAAEAGDVAAAGDEVMMAAATRDRGARGIIPRCVSCLFGTIRKAKATHLRAKVSYVEIHNERVVDLLGLEKDDDDDDDGLMMMTMMKTMTTTTARSPAPAKVAASLEIREDARRGIVALGAEEVEVNSEAEVMDVLWHGARRRVMDATDLNDRSSRSHTIFTVVLEDARSGRTYSKLNLVDLAGSEKWRSYERKEFSQRRIKELTAINGSLSCLAKCVSALLRGAKHVPFRDSKLTRLLQDSIGPSCLEIRVRKKKNNNNNNNNNNKKRAPGRCFLSGAA